HPVRRAMYSATVSPTTRSCSWGNQPTKASAGDSVTVPACGWSRPASSLSSVDFPAPLAPTTPRTSPGATVRSSESKRVRWPYPPARPWVTRVAVIGQSCHRGGTRPSPRRGAPAHQAIDQRGDLLGPLLCADLQLDVLALAQ